MLLTELTICLNKRFDVVNQLPQKDSTKLFLTIVIA